jgi:MFS family permease
MSMRWKILLTLDLLNVFAFAFWGPLFTAYAVHLGASLSLAGFLYGFYTLLHALAFLAGGKLSDKKNKQLLIATGYFIQALTAFVFIAIDRPAYLVIPLAISAVAGGIIAPAWKSLFTKVLQKGKEGRIWSFYDSGEAFVIAGGTFIAGILGSMFGFKAIFIPLFVLNIVAVVISFDKRLTT